MVRTALKVLAADVILLVALFNVIQDIQWRTSYAASPHQAAPNGYTPAFAYNIFTQFFTMSGNGVSLTSPPTLDWVQLLAAVLVLLNAWFFYTSYKGRASARLSKEPVALN